MSERILGIDIGATSIKFGAVDRNGIVTNRNSEAVAAQSNETLIDQLHRIIARDEFIGIGQVGIGSPGPLDLSRGMIVASANMPRIRDLEVVALLKKQFPQKDIRLDNDANAATLGAQYFGAGKNVENFTLFTLGTGVGGGCVYERKLRRGLNGNFFEVGHVFVGGDLVCGCKNTGCLETIASATGVSAAYRHATRDNASAAEIAKRAAAGDAHAVRAYEGAGAALGLVAATITQLMNITTFIFTGGMAAAEAHLTGAVSDTYRAHTFDLFHPLAKFVFTRGDENAGVQGAAALFLE